MVQTHGEDASEQRVIDDVRRVGWHLVGIEDDPEGPAFVYSIGLYHTLGQPEIIIFGLNSTTTMAQIINNIGDEMRSGAKFDDWHESSEILEGYFCMFRRVDRDTYRNYLGFGRWFYQGDGFPTLQCIWPDKEGRYPWHPDFLAALRERQPVLARKHDWPFPEGKNRVVFTTRPVIEEAHPVLLVTHDEGGDWQFLCGTTNRTEDGRLVSLSEAVDDNRSLLELADLPVGWQAVRESADKPWRRMKNES